jgi:hypothetical protein
MSPEFFRRDVFSGNDVEIKVCEWALIRTLDMKDMFVESPDQEPYVLLVHVADDWSRRLPGAFPEEALEIDAIVFGLAICFIPRVYFFGASCGK